MNADLDAVSAQLSRLQAAVVQERDRRSAAEAKQAALAAAAEEKKANSLCPVCIERPSNHVYAPRAVAFFSCHDSGLWLQHRALWSFDLLNMRRRFEGARCAVSRLSRPHRQNLQMLP